MPSPLEGFIRGERIAGVPGDIADNAFTDKLTFVNVDPAAKQVVTFTTPADPTATPGASHVYTFSLNGVEVSYASDASPTRAEIAAGLANAVNQAPLINGTVVATNTSTAVVVTARFAGEGFEISAVDSSLTYVVTNPNGTAAPVPFGRLVITDGVSTGSNKRAKLVTDADVADAEELATLAAGVTIRDLTQETALNSIHAYYEPNEAMSVLRNGRIYVAVESDITNVSNNVYVRVEADGALDQLGGFAPAAGDGLVLWTGARWVRQAGPKLAVLEVNL